MTTQVEHSVVLSAPIEAVWEFIADPGQRARAISVVEDYEIHDDEGKRATWHISLPIPLVGGTVAVETEERTREPPRYVEFVGRSKAMRVVGEHELTEVEGGTRLENRFVVDGRLPGVEAYFKRNLERELRNLMSAATDALDCDVVEVDVDD